MNSIFKRINAELTMVDFDRFISPVINGGLMKKTEKLESLEFNMLREIGSGQIAYHAIVRIDEDFIDQRVVRKLKRQSRGKAVKPVEFHFLKRDNDTARDLYERPAQENLNDVYFTNSTQTKD